MAPAVASLPAMRSLSTIAPEIVGRATCPLCHTVDSTMTNSALSAGAEWHCSRCGQRWDTTRLAAVAGYAMWLSARTD
jgi:transcription elongation factor Elf1